MPNNLVLPKNGSKTGGGSRTSAKSSRSRLGSSNTPLSPRLGFGAAIATLALGKASRVFAAFVSFHYLQEHVALPNYLFFVTLGASICLLALQRPWNGRRIGNKRTRRIMLVGGMLAFTLYLWSAGLRSAGPLRTLLVDGAELPLIYLFAIISGRELPEKRKTRGAICMLLAYSLLIWDASGHVPDVRELEHSKLAKDAEETFGKLTGGKGDLGHKFEHQQGGRRKLLTTYNPPVQGSGTMRDAFVEGTALRSELGVILVLCASVVMQWSRGMTRRLAAELGGAKRQFALCCAAACGWLAPLAAACRIYKPLGAVLSLSAGIQSNEISLRHGFDLAMVGFLWLVLPYYVRALVSTSVPQRMMMQSAVVVPFVLGGIGSLVVGSNSSAGGLSWILLLAFCFVCMGVSLMMAGGVKRSLSELPIDTSGSTTTNRGGGVVVGNVVNSGNESNVNEENRNEVEENNLPNGKSEMDSR